MKISDYLDESLIAFVEDDNRDRAIETLVHLADIEGYLPNKEEFRTAIFHREQLVSTGIGMGVAIPHAKLKSLTKFFIVIGIQPTKGIEWLALDKAPVRLIFMIGGPEDRQTEYLQILSLLTSAIRDVDLRKKLLTVQNVSHVFELFSSL